MKRRWIGCGIGQILVLMLSSGAQSQPAAGPGPLVVIHAGTLIDGVSRTPRRKVSIVIEGERIKSLEDGFVQPQGARVIDLSTATVMPGLIDTHTHVSDGLPAGASEPMRGGQHTPAALQSVVRMTRNAANLLNAGFTSIRNVGADESTDLALKRAIEDGVVTGPRMWVSLEPLGPTGGHSDGANGTDPDLINPHWENSVADTPDGYRRLVREHHRRGADLIKIMPSGGVLSIGDNPHHQLMTDEEIKAAIDTAHALGMRVAAHAAGKIAINTTIRLGVDSIEHGSFADEESFRLFRQYGAYLVPTVLVAERTRAAVVAGRPMRPTVAEKNYEVWMAKRRMLAAAYRAGVKIAFGSDTGDGRNADEFQYLVEIGMAPIDAIMSATGSAADLIGATQDIGSIRPGRYADIVATNGDPLSNIHELEDIDFVMKGGAVVKVKR